MDYLEPMTAAVRAAANIYRSAKNDLHIEVKGEDKNNLVTAYDKQILIKNSIFRNSLIFQGLPPIKYQNLMYFPLFLPL